MKSMSQCVTDFRASEEFDRLAETTKKRQIIVLNRLLAQVGGSKPINTFTRDSVNAVLRYWRTHGGSKGTGVSPASINAYMADIRRFGTWLVVARHMPVSPAAHLRNVKVTPDLKKRRPVSASQARELVRVADAVHARDGMTAMLMLHTGLRESEVIKLRWDAIDLEDCVVWATRFKTSEAVAIKMTKKLHEALSAWRESFVKKHGPLQDEWFVVPALAPRSDRPGFFGMNPAWPMNPLNRQNSVGTRVKSWIGAVDPGRSTKGRASHTLRRTAANMVADKFDIRIAQTFLGHKSLEMTERYLDRDAAKERLDNAMDAFDV